MTHPELTDEATAHHHRTRTSGRTRRRVLGVAGALAAAAALAVPGVLQAASLDVDAEATFEEGATTYTVGSVTLDEPGYVVIREGTATEPAAAIGASTLLTAGTHSDVAIDLDRAIEDGETLWVVAHEEANGNTTFDGPDTDTGVVDTTNGNLDLTGALSGLLGFPVLQTVNVVQTEGAFEGEIAASGVSLVVFNGTSVADLLAAAQAEDLISVAATVDGEFVVYVVGAPEFVNAAFESEFTGGFASTPVAVTR